MWCDVNDLADRHTNNNGNKNIDSVISRSERLRKMLLVSVAAVALLSSDVSVSTADEALPKLYRPYLIIEGQFFYADGEEQQWAEITDVSNTPPNAPNINHFVKPDKGWAGRIGVGAYLSPDWDVAAIYSGLRTKDGKDSGREPGYFYPVLAELRSFYDAGFGSTSQTYDMLDFEAGYNVTLGAEDQHDVRLAPDRRNLFQFPNQGVTSSGHSNRLKV
jgi:hypothetical protein